MVPRGRRSARAGSTTVDLSTRVGSITLPSPVMNASGTAGHADELGDYVDLARLGAFVVKSLCVEPWKGNPAPRVHMTRAGMINSVGLQGPGIDAWLATDLPLLRAAGVRRVVVSIWGTTVAAFAEAAALLADVPAEVIAIECNLSCPNTESGRALFAHDPRVAAEVVSACVDASRRPVWAKLSANTDRLVEVAGAVAAAGADAATLVNTLFGMVIDPETRRPVLSAGGGGVSGAAIHPVAVRAVYDVAVAHPGLPIVGVGGITTGEDAVEMLLAGASAVQVGTAVFADPRVLGRVGRELEEWCAAHGVATLRELIGAAHEKRS
ncbi:MAG TPA: dihydroorotate dehydrogenase [Acidimicrobiales bacterium]|nr:dihydroorotate dehydrogenase [Acidimicrobiales bacterium]